MTIEAWQYACLTFGLMIVLLLAGLPIAFALGGVAVVGALLAWGGSAGLFQIATTAVSVMDMWVFIAVPLFILMAELFQASGIGDDMFNVVHLWAGRMRGGLTMGTVVMGAVLGALLGVVPASIAILGRTALPAILKRGGDKRMALGAITAGGQLALIIPPSVLMVVYASLTGTSAGKLLIGGFVPGILIAFILIIYVGLRSAINPRLNPPSPEVYNLKQKVWSLKGLVLPIAIIVAVLGAIYTGICTPTEAAAIGALLAVVSVAIYRKLNFKLLRGAIINTFRVTSFVAWIVIGAMAFSVGLAGSGASQWITDIISALPVSSWVILYGMMFILLALGCVLDPAGIIMVTTPVFTPLVAHLGFDPVWYGVLYIIAIGIGFLTPPFGLGLFVLKGVAPPDVTMQDIIVGTMPYMLLQLLAMWLCMLFPAIILWLPQMMK